MEFGVYILCLSMPVTARLIPRASPEYGCYRIDARANVSSNAFRRHPGFAPYLNFVAPTPLRVPQSRISKGAQRCFEAHA